MAEFQYLAVTARDPEHGNEYRVLVEYHGDQGRQQASIGDFSRLAGCTYDDEVGSWVRPGREHEFRVACLSLGIRVLGELAASSPSAGAASAASRLLGGLDRPSPR